MRNLLAVSALFFASAVLAKEIEFHSAAWNDLSIPLGITPYYLEINSKLVARKVSIEIEVYKQGKLVRTITSVEMAGLTDRPPQPLNLKCAIYFIPEGNTYKGKIVLQTGDGGFGSTDISVLPGDLDFSKGRAHSTFGETLADSPRVPVFQIIMGTSRFSSANTPETTLKLNPNACVLIGYLKKS